MSKLFGLSPAPIRAGFGDRVWTDWFRNLHAGVNTEVPATATSQGEKGSIAYDSGYVYVCIATNTWKRATLATW